MLRTLLISVVVCLVMTVQVATAESQRFPLWNDHAPIGNHQYEQADAWITVHWPAKPNGTAIVICPGGGYGGLVTDAEGHGIAKWLGSHGVTGVVLEYRLPAGRSSVPLLDAQRAMRMVRANASVGAVDPSHIGILGFSAGGHLASTVATHFDEGNANATDPVERVSCRPDFAVLVYPVISMSAVGHQGTKANLLGSEPSTELVELFSNERQVTRQTPPTFLAHARDDQVVSLENSKLFHETCRKHNVPSQLLELPSGDHGLNGYQGPMWDAWQEKSLEWLAALNLIPPDSVSAEEVSASETPPSRAESIAQWEERFAQLPFEQSPVLVGFATSMVKLMPRDMGFEVNTAKEIHLSLARNEKESFQVAVMPKRDAVTGVSVTVGDLTSEAGTVFPADNIDCDVMGYVETKSRPPYEVSYVGWWPDPILDFLGPIDIAAGDLQSFWVRVRATRDQAPGVYRGSLRVNADGVEPLAFEISIQVYDFTLPSHSPLPTAITFFERPSQMGGQENWQQMKFQYADFLADYYIDYDSLYRNESPDFEIIERLHAQHRLVAFNLGNVFNSGTKAEGFDEEIAKTIERLRGAYDQAKQRGLLPYAYIYGFDERPEDQFPLLEKSAQALRKAFPEVLLMTTSYDHSFGLDSVVKTIDAWCPLTPRFLPELADRARAGGKQVWWYICCGPHNPHANWFVEYAAIESRLLMGAMTSKMRPDGFLYYALTIWNANEPIESGPFTSWNPVSWTVYHGDGSLLCSGPGGKPVPTIRLENYRDGLEDFAYTCILEEIVRQFEAKAGELTAHEESWLEQARDALKVPPSLVQDMARYSRDPQRLYTYRNRLGELIDRSGVSDANPWGDAFGVRGFSAESLRNATRNK